MLPMTVEVDDEILMSKHVLHGVVLAKGLQLCKVPIPHFPNELALIAAQADANLVARWRATLLLLLVGQDRLRQLVQDGRGHGVEVRLHGAPKVGRRRQKLRSHSNLHSALRLWDQLENDVIYIGYGVQELLERLQHWILGNDLLQQSEAL
eukprot:3003247-Pyramimonas_sp.AAC.1